MSAGTMISLAADKIIMGRQSQLGPIDPQFVVGAGALSARAVVDQFERAKTDILQNTLAAHVWAPVLASIGPALLQEAHNALDYGERMVRGWLAKYMFKNEATKDVMSEAAARRFNDASTHKSHGRRIDRDEARSVRISVDDLEASQDLQEQVLTAYHIMTLLFEKGPATKVLMTDTQRNYVKNWQQQIQVPLPFAIKPAAP
jgi:membrane-bound ClpP family serine protease